MNVNILRDRLVDSLPPTTAANPGSRDAPGPQMAGSVLTPGAAEQLPIGRDDCDIANDIIPGRSLATRRVTLAREQRAVAFTAKPPAD